MTKIFPKSRICVIDCFSSLENGLNKAYVFAKNNNISLNSGDGKKIILGFCLKSIQDSFETTKSSFPKVLCISAKSNNNKIKHFVDTYFDKMMKALTIPYCGKYDLTSPDFEAAAEHSLTHNKPNHKFNTFKKKLKLRHV